MNCNRATIIIEDRCTINTESVIKFRTLLVFKNCLWYTCIRMKVRPVLSPTPDFWVKHHSKDSRVMDSNFSLVRHYFSHSITLGDVTNTWNWQVNSCQGLDPRSWFFRLILYHSRVKNMTMWLVRLQQPDSSVGKLTHKKCRGPGFGIPAWSLFISHILLCTDNSS